MATTVDTLETVYKATDRYSSVVAGMIGKTLQFYGAVNLIKAALTAAFGAGSVSAAIRFENLNRSMTALLGSSEAVANQFQRLRQIAQLPGMGFEEAIEGFTRLFAAGLDASLAERAMMAFGNALAMVGKGKEDLQGVLLALTQIASKSKLSAEEINQIAERVPQIRSLLRGAFGTADTEIIQKMGLAPVETITRIVEQLEKLPRVAGGTQNTLENFTDAFKLMSATVGAELLPTITQLLDRFTQLFSFFTESGLAREIGRALAQTFELLLPPMEMVQRGLFLFVATLESMPRILTAIGEFFRGFFGWINDVIVGIQNRFLGLINSVIRFSNVSRRLLGFEPIAEIAPFADMFDGIRRITGAVGGWMDENLFGNLFSDIGARADELMNKFRIFQGAQGGGPLSEAFQAMSEPLGQIANYTRQTAQNTQMAVDLRRFALGGGPLGEMGITPIEFFRGTGRTKSRGANGAVTVRFDRRDALSTAIEGVVNDVIEQLARTGQWPGLGMAR